MWQFPSNAIAPCSWTPEESQVESCEHQDNANIHCQPFPESVSEEHEIYTDYDGCHRHHVKHDSYLSAHFSLYYHSGRAEGGEVDIVRPRVVVAAHTGSLRPVPWGTVRSRG